MEVLVLSCNTGGGHNSAGAAVVERLRARGHKGERVDFLALAGEKVSQVVSGTYVGMAKNAPAAFGMAYSVGQAVSAAEHSLGLHSPVYLACAQVIPDLERYLEEHPCDAVVTPHLFPALALTEMKKRGMAVPLTVMVSTDYTCIPFFEEQELDWMLIPSGVSIGEFIRRGVDPNKLIPVGIPVSYKFRERVGREKARQLVGMEQDGKWVLIMGGSMGAGHISLLTHCLLYLTERDVRIAVICGSNQRLQREMERKFGGNGRVKVVGQTDKVARYMEASDLLYTKPGGITTTEGAVMGIPMVHMKPIPGCESRNRQLFTENGMSVSARWVLLQAMKGKRLLGDPEGCARMVKRQRARIAADSADQIVDLLELELSEREK